MPIKRHRYQVLLQAKFMQTMHSTSKDKIPYLFTHSLHFHNWQWCVLFIYFFAAIISHWNAGLQPILDIDMGISMYGFQRVSNQILWLVFWWLKTTSLLFATLVLKKFLSQYLLFPCSLKISGDDSPLFHPRMLAKRWICSHSCLPL